MAFSRTPLLARGPVDLHAVLGQLELLLRRSLRDNVTLEIRHHPQARWVDAEAVQLEASLLNLVLNAMHASPPGARITVTVVFTKDDVARYLPAGLDPRLQQLVAGVSARVARARRVWFWRGGGGGVDRAQN